MKENDDITSESVSNTACPVGGHKTVWCQGVSGTGLMFDGYYSRVTLPKAKAPAVKDQITIQAWVALGAQSLE